MVYLHRSHLLPRKAKIGDYEDRMAEYLENQPIKGEQKMNRKEIPAWVTYVLLALAIAMCAFGLIRGEWKDVMRKAVAICMECIGIG